MSEKIEKLDCNDITTIDFWGNDNRKIAQILIEMEEKINEIIEKVNNAS